MTTKSWTRTVNSLCLELQFHLSNPTDQHNSHWPYVFRPRILHQNSKSFCFMKSTYFGCFLLLFTSFSGDLFSQFKIDYDKMLDLSLFYFYNILFHFVSFYHLSLPLSFCPQTDTSFWMYIHCSRRIKFLLYLITFQ